MTDRDPSYLSLRLADIDVDGALAEAAARLPHATRSQFFTRGARAGAILLGGLALRPAVALARTSSSDVAILNFALVLEYLQASFYTEAERIGSLKGPLAQQAHVVGAHERAHVSAFQAQLGSAATKRPDFNFHGVTESASAFRATAVAFEDLAVAAYKEQLPKIQARNYVAAALSIHSVEARHAAWIRRLAGFVPAPKAFDEPVSDPKVIDLVNSTHFVTLHAPGTSAKRRPRFTG